MAHDGRKEAQLALTFVLAVSLAGAACTIPFETTKAGYLEPDTLAAEEASAPWSPPPEAIDADTAETRALAAPDPALVPTETYDLPALVDVALQTNPETRRAWEAARMRAAAFGRTLGEFLPDLEFRVDGVYAKYLFEAPNEPVSIKQYAVTPLVGLEWILFDFGRRAEASESARRRLLAANLNFNRALQEVIFEVQVAYFALDAARGMLRAAERNLASARAVYEAAEDRLTHGLATKPDVLLTKQARAKASYELESARVLVSDAEASLALAVGVPANQSIRILPLHEQRIPPELGGSVDALIDVALAERPDLAARVEELRAQEAMAREAKADLYPTVYASGNYGLDAWWYRFNGPPTVQNEQPVWTAGLGLRWSIFEGFARLNTIREAEAEAARVRAEVEQAELETIAAVWRAYHDERSAQKKYEYAEVLLDASQEAYDSNLESYQRGLATIVDLLTAERDLAEARYILVQSRADLLTQAARVAYVAGTVAKPAPGAPDHPATPR